MLLCAQSSTPNGYEIEFGPTRTRTDNQGNFRLEGFVGQTYWIEARGSKEGKNPNERLEMHSPSRKLSLVESAKDVRLRLSENGPFGAGCSR
jgi:hypothetical protein